MNVNSVQRFEDGGELTATKLQDFRSRLRPVGAIRKTKAVVTPVIEAAKRPEIPVKPLRAAGKTNKVSPNRNRPLPKPPVKEIIEKKPVELPKKLVEEKPVEAKKEEKQPEAPKIEKIEEKKKVEEVKVDEPGVFTRSVRVIGNFAKTVFHGIKDFFESVFGTIFGRVTKIKIGNQEVVFDGHDQTKKILKSESTASLKVELDPKTANVMKTVSIVGSFAANTMAPPPPPLPVDGKIPVRDWRKKEAKTEDKDQQAHTTTPCLKEIVEKRRQEQGNPSLHDDLAAGLAAWRNRLHLNDSDDEDDLESGFFQVTFTRDDGKQTDLSYDGDTNVEITTEIGEKKSRVYTGLQKKQGRVTEQVIDSGVLAAAFGKLRKVEKKDVQQKAPQTRELDLQSLLSGAMMRNAARLFEED